MSWIITDTISFKSSDIIRLQKTKKIPSLYVDIGGVNKPINTHNDIDYVLILNNYVKNQSQNEHVKWHLNREDYLSIQSQLKDINKRDLEFSEYVKDHLQFKPGTEAFEQAKSDYNNQFINGGKL